MGFAHNVQILTNAPLGTTTVLSMHSARTRSDRTRASAMSDTPETRTWKEAAQVLTKMSSSESTTQLRVIAYYLFFVIIFFFLFVSRDKLGWQVLVLYHPLYHLLSCAYPSSNPQLFMSCLMLSIHVIFCFSFARMLLTFNCILTSPHFISSSTRRLCSYQHILTSIAFHVTFALSNIF